MAWTLKPLDFSLTSNQFQYFKFLQVREEFPHPDTVLIIKKRNQQGILLFVHLDIPMGEFTYLNLAANKSLLVQHFDLHIVSDLLESNVSVLIAMVGLRKRFMLVSDG